MPTVKWYENYREKLMEEKPTYEELERQIQTYKILFETMEEGVVLIAMDGQIVQANPAAERILGLTLFEIENRNYTAPSWKVFREDGTEMPPEEMAGPLAMKNKRPVKDMIMGVQKQDGTTAWINVNASPLLNTASELEGVVASFTDITKHQRDKEALRLFKTVIKASSEAIAISHADGQLVYINPAHEQLFGYSLEEAQQLNYRNYYPPESVSVLNEVVAPKLARGENWEGILDVFDAHGRRFPLWEHAGSILDAQGKLLYGFGIMHDDTERKQAKDALKESNERYRSIMESMKDAAVITSEECCIEYMNPAMISKVGYDATGNLCHKALYDNDERCSWCMSDQVFQKKKCVEHEFKNPCDNRTYAVVSSPVCHVDGTVSKLSVFHDITDQKKMEEILSTSNILLEEKVKKRAAELEERNTALKIILEQREKDRKKFENSIKSSVQELILPSLTRLRRSHLSNKQKIELSVLEASINKITSPFIKNVPSGYIKLTPTEVQVANHIKNGSSSKDIAEALFLSPRTVDTHRYNIRKKMGLPKGTNLRIYLSSLK